LCSRCRLSSSLSVLSSLLFIARITGWLRNQFHASTLLTRRHTERLLERIWIRSAVLLLHFVMYTCNFRGGLVLTVSVFWTLPADYSSLSGLNPSPSLPPPKVLLITRDHIAFPVV
jgi:hypothetical protein